MRRGLGTFSSPQDEHARKAVLLGFPCEQVHAGVSTWLKSSRQRPTHLSASLPEYSAKQVPCRPDSYLKREPNVRTSLLGTRMMVSLTRLIVHFAIPVPTSLSASQNQLRIEKLGLCGKLWPQNCMNSSLNEMLKTCSLSLHLTPVHKFSAFRIAGMEWRKRFFKIASPGHDHPFDLTAPDLFQAFLLMYCGRSFVKPATWLRIVRPMCDAPHLRFLAVSPPGESRHLFSRFPCVVDHALCDLSGSMPALSRLSASL